MIANVTVVGSGIFAAHHAELRAIVRIRLGLVPETPVLSDSRARPVGGECCMDAEFVNGRTATIHCAS